MTRPYPLAPMSAGIRVLTGLVLALPFFILIAGFIGPRPILASGLFVVAIYVFVWFYLRPSHFVIRPATLNIVWPWRSEALPRAQIREVEIVDGGEFRRRFGWAIRIGAGGLWGGFGLLWTRRGLVRMYICRLDRMVLITWSGKKPLLITPDDPEGFVGELLD